MIFDFHVYKALAVDYSNTNSIESREMLCRYLDSVGMKMPKPIYHYDETDRTTWKYLGGRVRWDKERKKCKYTEVLNTDFLYGN